MNRFDALRLICRIISFGTKEDDLALADKVSNSAIDWPLVIEVASSYYVATTIYPSLQRKSLLDKIPEDVRDYFEGVYQLNGERNHLLRLSTIEVSLTLNSIDVEPLLLKGMANVISGVYDDPAVRIMNDIDILVPKERLTKCVDAMHGAGYQELKNHETEQHHYPPMAKEGSPAAIEIHTEIASIQYAGVASGKDMLRDSKKVEKEGGAKMLLASPTHRVIHNILHSQLHHGSVHPMYVHQMYDLALLEKKYGESVDWSSVERCFAKGKYSGSLKIYISLKRQLFDHSERKRGTKNSFSDAIFLWHLGKLVNSPGYYRASAVVDHYIKIYHRLKIGGEARKNLFTIAMKGKTWTEHFSRIFSMFKG